MIALANKQETLGMITRGGGISVEITEAPSAALESTWNQRKPALSRFVIEGERNRLLYAT